LVVDAGLIRLTGRETHTVITALAVVAISIRGALIWLSDTAAILTKFPRRTVGANHAFRRGVLAALAAPTPFVLRVLVAALSRAATGNRILDACDGISERSKQPDHATSERSPRQHPSQTILGKGGRDLIEAILVHLSTSFAAPDQTLWSGTVMR